jgi:hypothetical protein
MEHIIIALISGLCVAIPNLVATISSNKKNNVNDIKEDIQKSIKSTESIIKADIMKVRKSLSEETLARCKVDLINVMSRIQNGAEITEEERRILIEEKEQYNKLGGDSYVDDMFDRLKKEGRL